MRIGLTFVLLSLVATQAIANNNEWQSLFNGKDLSGWSVKGGKAPFVVEDNAIVGASVRNSPSTFLASNKRYDDFILELEIKVDRTLNSGVQFRSNSMPEYKNGAVHGYQMEADTSERQWSGGIYDQSRRGWLYNLTRNEACRGAFNNGSWNQYRIEAIGNHIRTWVNGVACSNMWDNKSQSGFIAFQVHGIGKDGTEGLKTRFRKIRIKTNNLKNAGSPKGQDALEINYLPNQLTAQQKADGWQLLFDGKTTKGWRGAKLQKFPSKGWVVDNGKLSVLSSNDKRGGNGGDIVTLEQFSQFELELDFKISKAANSGIKYFLDPHLLKKEGKALGLEFQILDDIYHPDAKNGTNGNRKVGSLYDLIAAENLSEVKKGKMGKKRFSADHWNRARIRVNGNKIEHWLNNIKVVEYDRSSQMYRALVAYSKYKGRKNFGQWEKTPILLQDHNDEVSFRSIKIRRLK
jgi:3-keto-disaccharide hydrolase